MQWWCSASAKAWTWAWVAYPGVWIVVALFAVTYWSLTRRVAAPTGERTLGWLGVATIWLSLDWPLGPLATGYLASVHAAQFLLVAMVAPPLLLLGARRGIAAWWAALPERSAWRPAVRLVTAPLVAAVAFNVVTIATHVPTVVDTLMVSQGGAFAIDAGWLLGGIAFWWPVCVDVPVRPRFGQAVKMLYLFLGTLFHSGIAIVMLMRDFPMYGVYELAPPMSGLSAIDDLKIAGGIMELAGLGLVVGVISVMFFRWSRSAEQGAT